MGIESETDRLAYLTTFGQIVTIAGAEIQAILDNDYEPVQFGSQVVESNVPVLQARASDVATVAHGDSVVVAGVSYTVREIRQDGEGMVEFILAEV